MQTDHDPVHNVHPLGRFHFVSQRPPSSADLALVFLTSAGRPRAYLPQQQPTRGELVSGNYRTLYEVRMGVQHMTLEHRLPSSGDAAFFTAETDVTWRVVDPQKVVELQIRDVRTLIQPRLLARMRQASRRYEIEQGAAAETAVNEALADEPIAAAEGLDVQCHVRVSLDREAIQQHASLRSLSYESVRTENEHELAQLKARNERDSMRESSDFYVEMLAEGELGRWGLHLARNPGDVPLAIQSMRDDEREASANQIRIIERLLDSGVIEDHLLEETARAALSAVKDRLQDAGQGRTRKPPLYREQLEKGPSAADPRDEQPGEPGDRR
ncbi:hypothetical protein [Streptomyces sp. NPDC046887]|uniref:hypothetical protein n=1 Tax=Streptomyces sp. NPDC046887 TaxID=3155472 RepID=UPI0033FBBA40